MKMKTIFQIMAVVMFALSACTPPGSSSQMPAQTITSAVTLTPLPDISSIPTQNMTLSPTSSPVQQPQEPLSGSILAITQHGITVTITNITFSKNETKVDIAIEVDPKWGFTFAKDDIPPQQVFAGNEPVITDENGNQYKPLSFQGASVDESQFDPSTGIARTSGHFTFEPVNGSQLTIKIWLAPQTVRAPETIKIGDLKHVPTLPKNLTFGELSTQIKTAAWTQENTLKVTVNGMQQDTMVLDCFTLYTDTKNISPGDDACEYTYGKPEDRSNQIILDPSNQALPVEVHIAGNIDFLTPFQFTWIRSKQ